MASNLPALKRALLSFARRRRWQRFHTPKNLAMAMSVEAAEVVEIFQWLTPAQSARLDARRRGELSDELADTYIYLLRLAQVCGIDLVRAAFRKMRKNEIKYPVGAVPGKRRR